MAERSEPPAEGLSEGMDTAVSSDSRTRLNDLVARATLKYSVKDYNAAAELYSQATELQADLNGEMSSQNADLLYAYGRCLYHVAVRNSDVLGSKVASEKREEGAKTPSIQKQKKAKIVDEVKGPRKRADKDVGAEIVEQRVEKEGEEGEGEEEEKGSKPYFLFTGDESFDTSDEEEDGAEGGDEDRVLDDEEDDFANAYEVLDLARVLLLKRLGEGEVGNVKANVADEAQPMRQLKERLADTYDLQAEISLEGERFPIAVVDLKAALALKEELCPQESSLIAEAHYKLSLALEFSSVTQQKNEDGEVEAGEEAHVDETMREEAAKEMEAAIASCKLRIQQEEARLGAYASANGNTGKSNVTNEDINEVKEMVKDMEQRVRSILEPSICSITTYIVTAHRTPPTPSFHQRSHQHRQRRRHKPSQRHPRLHSRRVLCRARGQDRGGIEGCKRPYESGEEEETCKWRSRRRNRE